MTIINPEAEAGVAAASQADAEAGTNNNAYMSPLRTKQAIDALGTPSGMISAWPTATIPSGYLECDGSAVSRTTYADLFAVISDDYGAGDGSTTFNLPDFRGEFLRGHDDGAGNDPDRASRTDRGDGTTGDAVGTKQGDQYRSHTHGFNTFANNSTFNGSSANSAGTGISAATNASGGNETRPRNVSVKWVIKT